MNTMTDKLIERLAKLHWEAAEMAAMRQGISCYDEDNPRTWDTIGDGERDAERAGARAILRALTTLDGEQWLRVTQVHELVKQEGDAACEGAFDDLIAVHNALQARVRELEHAARTRPDYDLRCQQCGAAHNLDTSLPSEIWNAIAPDGGVLCALCIDERLAAAGLTAECEFYFVGTALRSRLYVDVPIPMLIYCPGCENQHVDTPEPEIGWTNPPHKTHRCKFCGLEWRHCNVPTTGVERLP